MAIYWVDPYRAINENYKCHGTTGDIASRDGSYANPLTHFDILYPSGYSDAGRVYSGAGEISLSLGDEIRIKGEPLSHIFQSACEVTQSNTSSYVRTKTAVDDPNWAGVSDYDKVLYYIIERDSTLNSAGNLDFYSGRPLMFYTFLSEYETDGTMSFNFEQSAYTKFLKDSQLRTPIGTDPANYPSLEMRLIKPDFISDKSTLADYLEYQNYPLGVTGYGNNDLRITDRWNSETTQSDSAYSMLLGWRRSSSTSSIIIYNYVAWDCPNTWIAPAAGSTFYDYGFGNSYYLNNQANHALNYTGPSAGFYMYGHNTPYGYSLPTPVRVDYYQVTANSRANLNQYGMRYQQAYGDFDLYYHFLDSSGFSYFYDGYLQSYNTSLAGGSATIHFGEIYMLQNFRALNAPSILAGGSGWELAWDANGAMLSNGSSKSPISDNYIPITYNAPIYNPETWPVSIGNQYSNADYPPNPIIGQDLDAFNSASGQSNKVDLETTNWFEKVNYTFLGVGQNGSDVQYHYLGEIKVPAGVALEDYNPSYSPGGGMGAYREGGPTRFGYFSTDIPDDDRMVWFLPYESYGRLGQGGGIAYLNSDGDVEVRPILDGSTSEWEAYISFSVPVNYIDSSGNPVEIAPAVYAKVFNDTGGKYANFMYYVGRPGSGYKLGSWYGSGLPFSSTSINDSTWTNLNYYNGGSLVSVTSVNLNSNYPGPFTTPPSNTYDHLPVTIYLNNWSGSNPDPGYKFVFRVPEIGEDPNA